MINEHSTWAEIAKAHDEDLQSYRDIDPRELSIEGRIEYCGRAAEFSHNVLSAVLKKLAHAEVAQPPKESDHG